MTAEDDGAAGRIRRVDYFGTRMRNVKTSLTLRNSKDAAMVPLE